MLAITEMASNNMNSASDTIDTLKSLGHIDEPLQLMRWAKTQSDDDLCGEDGSNGGIMEAMWAVARNQ